MSLQGLQNLNSKTPPQSTVDSSEPTDAQLAVEKELDRLDVLMPGHIEIANLLVRAKNSSARNLESKLAELRARRQVGSGNIYMGDVMLDNTVILLVQGNNLGIAKSLISSSIRETNVLMENKIYQTVKDPKQAERVVDQIHQLHADKQREFREKLTACGVDLDFQKAILDSNFDPDAALDISKEFWDVFSSHPAIKKFVDYGFYRNNIAEAAKSVMILHEQGLTDHAPNITPFLKEIPVQERGAYFSSLKKTIDLLSADKSLAEAGVSIDTIINHLSVFKDPAKALREAKAQFGGKYGLCIQAFEQQYKRVGSNTHYFVDSDKEYVAALTGSRYYERTVLSLLQHEPQLWQDLSNPIAKEMLTTRSGIQALATHLNSFQDLDVDIAWKLVDEDFSGAVVTNIDKFKDLDREVFAQEMIKRGHIIDLVVNLDAFSSVDHQALAEELVKGGYAKQFNEHYLKFKLIKVSPDLFKEGLKSEYCDFNSMYELYRNISTDKMHVMDRTAKIFGEFATTSLYSILDGLNSGVTAPELAELGVSKTGQEGLDQFEQRMSKIKADLLSHPEDHSDLILSNPMVQSLFKRIIRYEESEWGQHSQREFEKIIKGSQEQSSGGRPSGQGYEPSETVSIATIDGKKKEGEKPPFDEDVLNRYQRLRGQLQGARELLQHPQAISRGIEGLRVLFEQGIAGKEKALEVLRTKNPTKAGELEVEVAKLRGVNLRSLKDFEDNFMLLQSDKKLHDQLSTVMFAWAIRHPASNQGKEVYQNKLNTIEALSETPSLDDMSAVIDSVEHVINQETFQTYFQTDAARKAFSNMTSVESLQKALAKSQAGVEKTGTMPIRFEPTRGLLMEFSGHIADACWASKYDSIAQQFPNFTTVTIRQHPEGSSDNLVGAFMLIEAEAEDGGDPLLIIRGLNPRENFINKTDVGDFYTKTADYAKELAKKTDRRAAMVIDDHSGGSGTNRPVLYGYLSSVKEGLSKVIPKGKTEFNGYNIDNTTYLL